MNKLVADLHMHTIVSGHAYGTIREMATAAKEQNLELIGITEHAPGIPGTVDPFYYKNLAVIPKKIGGVELIHGCEINVLSGGKLSLEQEYLKYLDYAIVGIHMQCYQNEGREKNTENLIGCMKNEKVCFVSHPDDDHTPLDYHVDVSGFAVINHTVEVLTLFGVGAGNTIIGVDTGKFPFRILLNKFSVMLNLSIVACSLLIAVSTDSAVRRDSELWLCILLSGSVSDLPFCRDDHNISHYLTSLSIRLYRYSACLTGFS